jgi:hypothetical protein
MVRRSSSTCLRLEALEDRFNPSALDPVAATLPTPPSTVPGWGSSMYQYALDLPGAANATDNNNHGNHVAGTDGAAGGLLLPPADGETRSGTNGIGGGGGAGKVFLQDFPSVAKMSKATADPIVVAPGDDSSSTDGLDQSAAADVSTDPDGDVESIGMSGHIKVKKLTSGG